MVVEVGEIFGALTWLGVLGGGKVWGEPPQPPKKIAGKDA
jgi:hypothetical protein